MSSEQRPRRGGIAVLAVVAMATCCALPVLLSIGAGITIVAQGTVRSVLRDKRVVSGYLGTSSAAIHRSGRRKQLLTRGAPER